MARRGPGSDFASPMTDGDQMGIELRRTSRRAYGRRKSSTLGARNRLAKVFEVFREPRPSTALYVKPKLHHVSVLDDILFSFNTELACLSGFRE